MIAKGAITKRAQAERLPAQTVERDYVLANLVAEIGAAHEPRLLFKGGTLLRLCYLEGYRYSADLDFSAIDGLTSSAGLEVVQAAVVSCRDRLELPLLEMLPPESSASARIQYVGPLGAKARQIKLDISDDELVESHGPVVLQPLWPDLPANAAIEAYDLLEITAEKLRCVAERLQCRDYYDLDQLLQTGQVDSSEAWHLYLRKSDHDTARSRQRTSPAKWLEVFAGRTESYGKRWEAELPEYVSDPPRFADIDRRARRKLAPVLEAAGILAATSAS